MSHDQERLNGGCDAVGMLVLSKYKKEYLNNTSNIRNTPGKFQLLLSINLGEIMIEQI